MSQERGGSEELGRNWTGRQWFYSLLMLAIASVPLLILTRDTREIAWLYRLTAIVAFLAVSAFWSSRTGDFVFRNYSINWTTITSILLFSILAWYIYYEPMRIRFWSGYDEFALLSESQFKTSFLENNAGRPLLFHPYKDVAKFLTPNRIEGFLWIGFLLWLANAILLKSICDLFFPHSVLGILAGLLLLADAGEPLRYMMMGSAHAYLRPLFWLLVATWLYLHSWKNQDPFLLALSVLSLVVSILISEGVFPLAVIPPLLLLTIRRKYSLRISPWVAIWVGMIALLAWRFVDEQLVSTSSYQARQLGRGLQDIPGVVESLKGKFDPVRRWVHGDILPNNESVSTWLFIFLLVIATVVKCTKPPCFDSHRFSKVSFLAIGAISISMILLGSLPFLHIPNLYRTQFLVGPGFSLLVAWILLLTVSMLPNKVAYISIVISSGFLVATSATSSYREQSQPMPIYFAKTAHVFEQINRISPNFRKDTLIVLLLEDKERPSLSYVNYHVRKLSEVVLNVNAIQINFEDPLNENAVFTDRGIVNRPEVGNKTNLADKVDYAFEEMVVFRVQFDGTVSLVEELPIGFWPEETDFAKYQPLRRMFNDYISPPRYLQLPSWARPQPRIAKEGTGFLYGKGWGDLVGYNNFYTRSINETAFFFVNSEKASEVDLKFTLEQIDQPVRVALESFSGEVLAEKIISSKTDWAVTVPTSVKHPTRFVIKTSWANAKSGLSRSPSVRCYLVESSGNEGSGRSPSPKD